MIARMLNIGDFVTMNDVRRVVDAAKKIDSDEELIVTMKSQESYKADNIFTVLERNNFDCSSKGGHDGKDYYIIVRRKQI